MTTMHWAAPLIGKPWAPAPAEGPHAFYCWGLVRHVFALRHRIDLPVLAVGEAGNEAAIAQAVHASGWRRVQTPAQADDVLLMRGPAGRHVGVIVATARGIRVLHAAGTLTERGPVGCVVSQTLAEATADGYHDFELWRRAQ